MGDKDDRQNKRSWLQRNLSGLSGWIVIVGVSIATIITVMSQGIAEDEVLWHEEKEMGAHIYLEVRVSQMELQQALLANDVGHIKKTIDTLNTAAASNKTVLDAILIKVNSL